MYVCCRPTPKWGDKVKNRKSNIFVYFSSRNVQYHIQTFIVKYSLKFQLSQTNIKDINPLKQKIKWYPGEHPGEHPVNLYNCLHRIIGLYQ